MTTTKNENSSVVKLIADSGYIQLGKLEVIYTSILFCLQLLHFMNEHWYFYKYKGIKTK